MEPTITENQNPAPTPPYATKPAKLKLNFKLPKINLMILSFALFMIFAFALVAFFYYQNQQLKQMLAKSFTTPTPSPTSTPNDPLSGWKAITANDKSYQFRIPGEWYQPTPTPNSDQKIIYLSNDGLYRVTVDSQPNINSKTNKAYLTLDEFVGLPYTVKSLTVSGMDARQPLPRAGSENLYKVYFMTPDLSKIMSIEIMVGDNPQTDHRVTGDSLQIGEDIFNKIISTFKFNVSQLASPSGSPTAKSTCVPRPACLDQNPKCLIPESSDMCPAKTASPSPSSLK